MPPTLPRSALLAFPLLLATCRAEPQAPAPPVETVDETRMQRTVRELVALGTRGGGTASGAAAARYRANAFRAAGLSVRVLEDPETWAHQAESWHVSATTTDPSGKRLESVLERAVPLGFSPNGAGRFPLALEPTPGAALLTEHASQLPTRQGGSPRSGPGRDSTDPLAAALPLALVDGDVSGDGAWPVLRDLAPGRGPHPFAVFGLSRPEGAALRAALASGARVEIDFELVTHIARARPLTVEATLGARAGAPPGFFLVCAHGDSDSGGPGANDNASGESIVLELARVWGTAVRAGELPAPPRAVRFAIWGKEIHSSEAYLERAAREPTPFLGVLNFDQSGFGSSADRLFVEPDDLPANGVLVRVLAGVLEERSAAPGFPAEWATVPSLGGTDSYVFSGSELFRDERRPSVTVYSSAWNRPAEHPRTEGMPGESWSARELVAVDYDDFYHSAGDLPENTTEREPWNMGWCVRVSWVGLVRYLEGLDG